MINGLVKVGEIPKGAKPNQNISAAQNFGFGLKILRRETTGSSTHRRTLTSRISGPSWTVS